jgi:hypothetical protein
MMASFFKECPHPDDKQRKELSRELGLEPLQVKFWFQNKRTQMKVPILPIIISAPPDPFFFVLCISIDRENFGFGVALHCIATARQGRRATTTSFKPLT